MVLRAALCPSARPRMSKIWRVFFQKRVARFPFGSLPTSPPQDRSAPIRRTLLLARKQQRKKNMLVNTYACSSACPLDVLATPHVSKILVNIYSCFSSHPLDVHATPQLFNSDCKCIRLFSQIPYICPCDTLFFQICWYGDSVNFSHLSNI